MGRAKGLTDDEKATIVKKTAEGTDAKGIATSLGRHVDTVKSFLSDPSPRKKRSDSGTLKAVTTRELRLVKKTLVKKPGQSSKTIFQEAHLPEVSKSTRCRLLRNLVKNVQPQKQPPLSLRHKQSRLQWAKKYMETDMKMVLFTDETRATLDGPDG